MTGLLHTNYRNRVTHAAAQLPCLAAKGASQSRIARALSNARERNRNGTENRKGGGKQKAARRIST
jgi:hypothetical protein